MPQVRSARHGSMQYWPRKRAQRIYSRVRSWAKTNEAKILGFAGFKVCMTDVVMTDNKAASMTKGQDIVCPVTIIECPPLKIYSVRFYKKTPYGIKVATEVVSKVDKEVGRKVSIPKKEAKLDAIDPTKYDDITLLVYTQQKLTGLGSKKPSIFEIGIGGKITDKFNYAKEKFNKEITVNDAFKEGQQIDVHAVTKGKGVQGPVKRFGVAIRSHKAEKTKRGPASLGGWRGQGHVMYRVAHAGQMGFHARTDYNKWLMKIGNDIKEINPSGGFASYPTVKNSYIILKGSIPGPSKRIMRLVTSIRPNRKIPKEAPTIQEISLKR